MCPTPHEPLSPRAAATIVIAFVLIAAVAIASLAYLLWVAGGPALVALVVVLVLWLIARVTR